MLNKEDYEILKESFIDSQRLFDKLNRVSDQAKEIEYDESGLFLEDEETLERHWLKLSSKIVDVLSVSLKDYNIELLKNKSIEERKLTFNLVKGDESSKIYVDYSENGALSISQLS
ncbi:hypothetical protein KKG72_08295 [bacterium]|nr:hypothetical protein [bacterium]MBU1994635.1 hypothetical protein [bacterium]